MKNPVIGKVSCRRIGFDCIGRSADKWGTFVHKKKSAAESVTPEVLVNPQIQQNSAHPSGNGLYLNLQKIYQISGCQYNRLYTRYVKNACNYGVLHSKGNQFSAICNYQFEWSREAERVAEKRHAGGVYGRIVSPRVFRACVSPHGLRAACVVLRGFKKQAASRKGKPLVWCFLWNAYSLRGVTLTYDLPAPFLQNSTVPSTRAKSVWSLPIPTFSPGL